MDKKEYRQPDIKVRFIKPNAILVGSLKVQSSGFTSEQNAKSFSVRFEFDDDNEEDY